MTPLAVTTAWNWYDSRGQTTAARPVFDSVTAVRFDGRVKTGKTRPAYLTCEKQDGQRVEVVAKFSANCERKITALVVEALSAMLAADLGLPVPQPFMVRVDAEFANGIPDQDIRDAARRSSPVVFGSEKLPGGYSVWQHARAIPPELIDQAAEIYAFDQFTMNSDRRPENPNCMFDGNGYAVFDHELCFLKTLAWQAPWFVGSLTSPFVGTHLFAATLKHTRPDMTRLATAWRAISPDRLHDYRQAIPQEWAEGSDTADEVVTYLTELGDNIGPAFTEVGRVLS